MKWKDLLEKLQTMTPEELDHPVELAIRTYTKAYPDYCYAFDFRRLPEPRIYASFKEGIIISKRKKQSN